MENRLTAIFIGLLVGFTATLYIGDAVSNYNFWNCSGKDKKLALVKGISPTLDTYRCIQK